jgi:signal peptidase I
VQRLGLTAGALAASATLAIAVAAVVALWDGHLLLGVLVAVAIAWSCAPLLALLTGGRHPSDAVDHPATVATVTTVVRLGDEPPETARSSIALARREGPTVIIAAGREVPDDLAAEADAVHVGATIGEALVAAATEATTDAILVVSARAVPRMAACRRAAALLDDRTGWVSGASRPFNRDRYASDRREVVGAALRRRSVASLALWETDATLVRRDLLVAHPLVPGRPWGAWLRARASEGLRGERVDETLSWRAAPVAAGSYWPDAVARQRASAADLSMAICTGPLRARLGAALLLARELYAYPLVVWFAAPLLIEDAGALGIDVWGATAALVATAVVRWWSLRAALGLEVLPRADITSALYHAPGSLAALLAAIRRRVTPLGRSVPTRPLVWAALVLTAVAGYGLVRNEPGATSSRLAVVASIAMLGMLWAFTIRSLVERTWSRSSYRVRLAIPASVDGVEASTVDGSPGGVAVRGRFDAGRTAPGTEVEVQLRLDDGTVATVPAVVAARRPSRGEQLLGLELHPGTAAMDAWSAQLLRAVEAPAGPSVPTVAHQQVVSTRGRLATIADRVVVGAVVAISVAVIAALVLVLLGFRPLVIRSGSMVPTYGVGDVVLVDQVRADELRAGDVASLEYYPEYGESLTHRVRSVREVDGRVDVETRGDANDSSENWSVPADALVGRVVASIPAIGAPATLVRTATVPLVIGVVVVAIVLAVLLRGRRPGPTAPDAATSGSAHVDDEQGDDAEGGHHEGARAGSMGPGGDVAQ